MATFPNIPPDYDAQKVSEPKFRITKFGDGYEHRIRWGLNQNPKVWNLTWTNITETDADTIEAFLDARANDGDDFTWTPPGEATSSKWVCQNWQKSIPYLNTATITATFRQVFDL